MPLATRGYQSSHHLITWSTQELEKIMIFKNIKKNQILLIQIRFFYLNQIFKHFLCTSKEYVG